MHHEIESYYWVIENSALENIVTKKYEWENSNLMIGLSGKLDRK